MLRSTKPPKCKAKGCRERVASGPFCGDACADAWIAGQVKKQQAARQRAAKAERKQDRAALESMKKLPKLHREAQAAFNAWVRARDAALPCISCDAPPPDLSQLHAGRDAGHYRSVGSAAHLRYHEDNVHGQCVHCNQFGSGRAVEYRRGLIARIGLARVEALETSNEPHKWTREEVRAIRDTYRAKLRALKKENA